MQLQIHRTVILLEIVSRLWMICSKLCTPSYAHAQEAENIQPDSFERLSKEELRNTESLKSVLVSPFMLLYRQEEL